MKQPDFEEAYSKLSPAQLDWVRAKAKDLHTTEWYVMDYWEIPDDERIKHEAPGEEQ
jgi:hypothetical protein